MRLTYRDKIRRWLLFTSVVASGLIASLLALPVFAGECPLVGTCG